VYNTTSGTRGVKGPMTQDYQKTWEAMNSLELVSSKICSAREILDCAIESFESGNREKTETLLYAVDEFLKYYLRDFDEKFKSAWNETVVKLKQKELSWDGWTGEVSKCDKNDPSPECQSAWTSFWEENYYPEEYKGSTISSIGNPGEKLNAMGDVATKDDKVIRWRLPVEEVKNGETDEQEYFMSFPDDLLEAANLKEGDEIEWVDLGDGSYMLKKVGKQMTYDEAIAAGWTMTADGFWIKE